jgi:PAS domain S-box-containing protein
VPTQSHNRPFTRIPLRLVLIVPFVAQVALVVGLVGYLSFRNGQQAVNKVARQLRSEITARIEDHLRAFLATPHQINRTNANAIRQGLPAANDPDALEHYLWEQIQVFDSVTSVYFGNTEGGLVDAGREGAKGSLYVIVTDEFKQGPFRKYATDSVGNRSELLTTIPDFDARTRSWYSAAVEKGDATWSDVYILFTGQDMALSASRPVYDEQQNLLGVVSNGIFVSHMGDFLKSLTIGETGSSFIMERSGLLVTSSTGEQPFILSDEGQAQERLYAAESTIPAIRYAAAFLAERFGDYHNITGEQQLEFEIEGQRQFLQVAPVQDEYGIDWLVVVIIPEADFMAQINAGNRTTAFLVSIALIAAVVVGVITTQRVSKPISHLNASAQALAQGEWDQNISEAWINEIGELTQSFNHMAAKLKQTLENLTSEVAERQRTEEALRESEERLDLALRGADLGLWDWNIPTGEVVFNSRWAEMLGYTLDEIEPNISSWERLVHPDDTLVVMEALNAHLEGRTLLYQTEHRLRTKSGDWKWILDTGKVFVRDEQGNPIRATGTHQDVTERKQAEEALRRSKHYLEETLAKLRETQEQMMHQERLATVGQLAAGIAHDFNNILAAIVLYTQTSLRTTELSPTIRKRLEVIAQQADRATDLVQQILDFGRRAVIERQPLALDSFLKEVVKLLKCTLPESVQIDLVFEPGAYVIPADPTRVQQAMVNLALNARDAMPDGGDLHIGLSRAEEGEINCVDCGRVVGGEWVQVTVQDSGTGIPPDVLPHIFEPFFTTRAPLGHGLGLAQVYGIVKQHGGHIEIETEVGRGTTLKLYWPALATARPEAKVHEKDSQ